MDTKRKYECEYCESRYDNEEIADKCCHHKCKRCGEYKPPYEIDKEGLCSWCHKEGCDICGELFHYIEMITDKDDYTMCKECYEKKRD